VQQNDKGLPTETPGGLGTGPRGSLARVVLRQMTLVRPAVMGAVYKARRNLGTPHPPNSQADTPHQRWELAKLLVPRTPLGGQELQRYNLEGLTNDEKRVRRTLAAALANPVLRASGNAKMTARILAHHHMPVGRRRVNRVSRA
jgi:hypothetical protein